MINRLLPVTAIALLLAACNSADKPTVKVAYDPAHPPVDTSARNTDYEPAFAGQTRIAGIHTATPYTWKSLNDSLKSPWGIVTLPDGRLLITEKAGNMRIADTAGKLSDPITGIPAVNSAGQGGLLGITIDPNFTTNRMVYWVFAQKLPEGNCTAVAKGRLANDEKQIENATVIYQAKPAYDGIQHYGGRVIFDKTGNLFVSTGERSDMATRPLAQSLGAALGKVLHITTDGKAAPGNPFAGQAGALPEIYCYGNRNVQGLAINPVTGDLWEAEFGPRGGDEINRIQPGKNYGWPTITYGLEYSGKKIGDSIQQKAGLEQPVYYWDPVQSPSGILFYTGDNMPEWKNNLFVCGLSSMRIARLEIKDDKVVGEEKILDQEKQRFRAITQGLDGALYAITEGGKLYRIAKK